MPGKSVQIHVWLIALSFLAAVTTMTAGIHPGAEITNADEKMGRSHPQGDAAKSNIFGFTVGDIYDRGVIVAEVEIGSPAAESGIRRGDVILAVNDVPVLGTYHFQKLIQELVVGPAIFTVSRFGLINRFIIDIR